MYQRAIFLLAIFVLFALALTVGFGKLPQGNGAEDVKFAATDWPWWRGPNRNGVAAPDQDPPLHWSAEKNVIWKTPVAGRGHGSPTVVGNRIFLATADEKRQIQSVLCFDRQTGRQLWKTDIFEGGFEKKGNKRSSHASSTVACDGKRLFVNFNNRRAVHLVALDIDGRKLWQKKITDYVTHQGFGSSPALFGRLVFVNADNKGGGATAAFDRQSGELVWKNLRPKSPNYASPIILHVAGKDQLFLSGCEMVSSFEPMTGKKLWEVEGATTECVTSTVTDGKIIFTSGGYPRNHIAAVRADGTGKILWNNNTRVYVPSMVVHEGHLYTVTDNGVALCTNCETGKESWNIRLGGTFNASLVLVGQNIFATNEDGQTFIYKASPKSFKRVAENQLGEDVFATPTICGNRIYMRVAERNQGRRQEMLYCIGKK